MAKYLGTPTPRVSTDGLEGSEWKILDSIAQLREANVTLKPLFAKVGETKYKLLGIKCMFCKMIFCI